MQTLPSPASPPRQGPDFLFPAHLAAGCFLQVHLVRVFCALFIKLRKNFGLFQSLMVPCFVLDEGRPRNTGSEGESALCTANYRY